MSSAPERSNSRLLRPRRLRRPSARNFAIHSAYRTGTHTQAALAEKFGLTQRRVSQIVRSVDRWMAHKPPGEEGSGHDAWLQWRLERERLKAVFDHALAALSRTRESLCKIRAGRTRAGQEFGEEVRREVNADPRWITTAYRAANQLVRLMSNPPPSCPDAILADVMLRTDIVWRSLCRMRRDAMEAGRVPPGDVEDDVDCFLCDLTGIDPSLRDAKVAAAAAGHPTAGKAASPGASDGDKVIHDFQPLWNISSTNSRNSSLLESGASGPSGHALGAAQGVDTSGFRA